MESKNSSRSEHAKNEKRDSNGRFESMDKKSGKTTASNNSSDSRSERAKNEKRDSNGRFESNSKK